MGHRIVRRVLLGGLAAAALAALPAAASAKTAWLCQPGKVGPCTASLTATVMSPAEAALSTQTTPLARKAPIDCFYVYPTVSEQPTPQASWAIDPAERSIALFQASRFSSVCRVWAPMYRQITLAGLLNPTAVTPAMRTSAYTDVRNAWRDYLAHDNHGRGVVFIGHSQGTFVLRELIAKEVDPRPKVRKLLVSAVLLGGNVTVAKGSDIGGDFQSIPGCRSASQLGCVIAYSTFNQAAPQNAVFGRVPAADADRLDVLCTNPAALGGGVGTVQTYLPTTPFGGIIGTEIDTMLGAPLPSAPTPWIGLRGSATAQCSSADGANVLEVTAAAGARELTPVPDPSWGLHLADVNIALGNLTAIVGRQAKAWTRLGR